MTALLVAVFIASLLGSLHCAGMCGPFCAVAVTGAGGAAGAGWVRHAAYHGGRLATYCLLGAAAGSLGALLNLASTLAGLQPVALAIAGGMMVLIGVVELARLRGWRLPLLDRLRTPSLLTKSLRRGQQFASRQRGVPRALVIGLLTTLLPCGWLYAFLITAAGAGGTIEGAAAMAAFWLGTVPVLLSLGVSIRRLATFFGERLPAITATALILVGFVTLAGRAQLSTQAIAATVVNEAADAQATDSVAMPNPHELPPCCRGKGDAP